MKINKFYGGDEQDKYVLKECEALHHRKPLKFTKNMLQARAIALSTLIRDTAEVPIAICSVPIGICIGAYFIFIDNTRRNRRGVLDWTVSNLAFSVMPLAHICSLIPKSLAIVTPELEKKLHDKIQHRDWIDFLFELSGNRIDSEGADEEQGEA